MADRTTTFETDRPFSERLPAATRQKLIRDAMQKVSDAFLSSLRHELRTSLGRTTFGPMAVERWPLLGSPAKLEEVYMANVRVQPGRGRVDAYLDDVGAAQQGLSPDLVLALEYGHPEGVPVLAIWKRAVRESQRTGLKRQAAAFVKVERGHLSRGGGLRSQALA